MFQYMKNMVTKPLLSAQQTCRLERLRLMEELLTSLNVLCSPLSGRSIFSNTIQCKLLLLRSWVTLLRIFTIRVLSEKPTTLTLQTKYELHVGSCLKLLNDLHLTRKELFTLQYPQIMEVFELVSRLRQVITTTTGELKSLNNFVMHVPKTQRSHT